MFHVLNRKQKKKKKSSKKIKSLKMYLPSVIFHSAFAMHEKKLRIMDGNIYGGKIPIYFDGNIQLLHMQPSQMHCIT